MEPSGKIRVGDSWSTSTVDFPVDDAWHLYTVTKTSDNAWLYLDGFLIATHGSTIANPAGSEFRIARQYPGFDEYFQGSVDELSVWNRALGACEVAALRNQALSGNEYGLIHLYNFNAGTGSELADLKGTATGYLINGPLWNSPGAELPAGPDLSVGTGTVSGITPSSATVSATIHTVGSGNATVRGIAYGLDNCPDISGNKTTETGTFGAGGFSGTLTELDEFTTYYARAYATNATGTTYGDEVTFYTNNPPVIFDPGAVLTTPDYTSLVQVPDKASLRVQEQTVSLWVKPGSSTVSTWQPIFMKCDETGGAETRNFSLWMIPNTFKIHFAITIDDVNIPINSSVDLIADQWNHVAGTYDGSVMTLYFNGMETATYYVSGAVYANSAHSLYLGGLSNGQYYGFGSFAGTLADARVYNTALTPEQIQASMRTVLTGTEPNLVYYTRLQKNADGQIVDIVDATHLGTLNGNAFVDEQVVMNYNTTHTFSSAEFYVNYVYYDVDYDNFAGIRIVTLPSNGTLALSSSPVTAGDLIPAASIANLTYTPVTGWGGLETFTWNAYDENNTLSNTSGFRIAVKKPTTVTTQAATSLGLTSATLNGTITDLGYPGPTQHGLCWGTSLNPTTAGSKSELGPKTATGAFTTAASGLNSGTTYHVRAYATNTSGTFYGSDVTFTTLSVPANPTGITGTTSICNGFSTTLTATGAVGTVYWYTGSCGGTEVASGNPVTVSPASNTTYYARNYNGVFSAGCASATVTVNPPSYVPVVHRVSELQATGTDIKWYSASTGGTALASTTALVDGQHYYASQTVNGVESLTRTDVTATLDPTPCRPSGSAAQTLAAGSTVASLSATGSNIRWYATASGGTALAASTALVNGQHYYATQTVDCTESTGRLEVAVTLE